MDRRDLRTAGPRAERELAASQWRLIRTRFLRHKMAVFSLVLLGIFYFGVLFAEFVAPNDPRHRHVDYQYSPPQRIRLIDTDGGLMIPGAFVAVAILAFNFVGDGLRDAADPYASS
jgi:ABC-type antimicrobial peptide transport system permease subunit